jgi:hypothetical protein
VVYDHDAIGYYSTIGLGNTFEVCAIIGLGNTPEGSWPALVGVQYVLHSIICTAG